MLSNWYNEIEFGQLYLQHYDWADQIIILLETSSNDGTRELLKANPKARIVDMHMPAGIDDIRRIEYVNNQLAKLQSGWVLFADADEFAFAPGTTIRDVVTAHVNDPVIEIGYYEVFRHESEGPLDYTKPPLLQRIHGNPNVGESYGIKAYIKPALVNCTYNPVFSPGIHAVRHSGPQCPRFRIYGAHWCMADADLAIKRRLGYKRRMSAINLKRRMAAQHFDITTEKIKAVCAAHLHDPVVIKP